MLFGYAHTHEIKKRTCIGQMPSITYFYSTILLDLHPSPVNKCHYLHTWMRKLRHVEVKELVQGHGKGMLLGGFQPPLCKPESLLLLLHLEAFWFFWKVALFFSHGELFWHETDLSLSHSHIIKATCPPSPQDLSLETSFWPPRFPAVSSVKSLSATDSLSGQVAITGSFFFSKLQYHSRLNN